MDVHVLCAVCGGPTTQVEFAKESAQDQGYNRKIVNEADAAWTSSCLLLGFNTGSTAIDK
jgi:hypothetical protein